jgi:hypothetical protein
MWVAGNWIKQTNFIRVGIDVFGTGGIASGMLSIRDLPNSIGRPELNVVICQVVADPVGSQSSKVRFWTVDYIEGGDCTMLRRRQESGCPPHYRSTPACYVQEQGSASW